MMPFAVSSRNAAQAWCMTRPPLVQKVQHDGLHLHVERRGHGPTVLLLHGFPDDVQLWHAVAPRLEAAGFHVIALDQRGCGASEAPAGLRHYHIDRLVGDAAGVLKALGSHSPVHVLGHDWGAVAAWYFALVAPERLCHLAILNVPHPYVMREHLLSDPKQMARSTYAAFFLPAM